MTPKRPTQRSFTPSEVTTVLASHGIAPKAAGYAWADLTALAAQHGWHVRVESAWTPSLGRHFQAMVWSDSQLSGHGGLERRSVKGRGTTDEDALANALARLLWRERTAEP